MSETQIIQSANAVSIFPKIYNNQRVVTFKDIEQVHEKEKGIAKRNFNRNKKHFILGTDYFEITRKEFGDKLTPNSETLKGNPNLKVILLTESGYLMIVKSFTDDLSWDVQRQLVNCYFKQKDEEPQIPKNEKSGITLPPAKHKWYDRNARRIHLICQKNDWEIQYIYHRILKECGEKYDLDEGKAIHKRNTGKPFEYAIDIVEYFPELQELANNFLDYLEKTFL